jgi:hypothetical protein
MMKSSRVGYCTEDPSSLFGVAVSVEFVAGGFG